MEIISYVHKSVELLFHILWLVAVWSYRPPNRCTKECSTKQEEYKTLRASREIIKIYELDIELML
jgi:hypothetical protein